MKQLARDNTTTAGKVESAAPYLRPTEATKLLPVSRRTLSNWQRRHVIPFYKIGRTVVFKRGDIESALERFRVAAVGEPCPRKRRMEHKK
jgi:excisionase family DNA binding protein